MNRNDARFNVNAYNAFKIISCFYHQINVKIALYYLLCNAYTQSQENITVARSLTGGRFVEQQNSGGRFGKKHFFT